MIFDRPEREIDERLQRLRVYLDRLRKIHVLQGVKHEWIAEAKVMLLDAEIAVQKLHGDQWDYDRLKRKADHDCVNAWCRECDGPKL